MKIILIHKLNFNFNLFSYKNLFINNSNVKKIVYKTINNLLLK